MLKINNLTKYYNNAKAIENINIELTKGEIFGLIGPNGSGKNTIIKCILNLVKKSQGTIYLDDNLIDSKNYLYKEHIGYLPCRINLYGDLTVEQMLKYSASFYKKDLSNRINELISLFELDVNKKIDELSYGNLKKVGIVISLMHEPKLLILEEPTNGLDPLMCDKLFNLLLKEKKKGTTILYSTHNLKEIKKLCDRVGIVKNGNLIETINTNEIIENLNTITIKSKCVKQMNLPLKEMHIKSMKDDEVTFIYKGNINKILIIINKYKIDKLLIEEPTVEEILINYYKRK